MVGDSKYTEACSPISTYSFALLVAQVPRSPKQAIFVQQLQLSGAHTPRASIASGLYPDLNLELENVDDVLFEA